MRVKSIFTLVVMLAFAGAGNSYADQKIKTKSNIKNDRIAQPVASSECAEKCTEGEQCVKPAVADAGQAETGKSYCAAVSEKKDQLLQVKNNNFESVLLYKNIQLVLIFCLSAFPGCSFCCFKDV